MKKILLALSLCAATALVANEDNYHWQFTPVIGGTSFDSDFDLKDEMFFGARIAKNFEEGSFFDHLEFGYDRVNGADVKGKGKGDMDMNLYHLSLIKNFDVNDDFKFYGLIGGGYLDGKGNGSYADGTKVDDYDSGFAQVGLGAKYYVTDNFHLRLEAKDVIAFEDETTHNLFYSLGFGVDFGSRTPAVVPVVAVPIGDEDGDGVPDNLDRCPGTPAGTVVDENGCEKIIRLDVNSLKFGFDSTKIKPESKHIVREISDFVADKPNYAIRLEGHTDSTGDATYNQGLSERRAAAVKDVLVELGVDANKITTQGYGETQPVATNSTKEGRAQNRRVDAKFRK
ncbi:OmpA family protein [Campylobacter corcagiensis]|uniref:OmpA family protein n=1 Tax=Campylobacter corcagiensis TaxID=1448857 RepID=A0A7M1LDH4_9BACT|nr:OmpA family protein [Campylobacter corcagiensis]QKF65279.1 outer membrane fibronectin-binding protein [Campylobacter corcagiensis]QOQ86588.1 OmpA family protein [Campylobacter corcagiensis]